MNFQRIGFSIKPSQQGIFTWLQLVAHLRSCHPDRQLFISDEDWINIQPLLSKPQAQFLNNQTITKMPLSQLITCIDLLVTLGGDGSLIRMAQYAPQYQLPVLGINLGRLGYLTDITPNNVNREVTQILQGNYYIDQRLMITSSIAETYQQAINEVCIMRKYGHGIIDVEVHVDGRFLMRQRSDGIIINTATGSTAYALANGGPILSTHAKVLCITPVCPHSLSSRPIIVDQASQISVITHQVKQYPCICYADGLEPIDIKANQAVQVRKSELTLALVHPRNYDQFETLRSKLRWG